MLLINILNNTLQQFSFFFSLTVSFFLPIFFSFPFIIFPILSVGFFSFFFLILQAIQLNSFFFTVKRVTRIKFVIDSLCDLHGWILFIESPRHQARRFRFWHRRQHKSTIRRSPMRRREPWNSMVSRINGRCPTTFLLRSPIFSVVSFYDSFQLVILTRHIAWSHHTRDRKDSTLI